MNLIQCLLLLLVWKHLELEVNVLNAVPATTNQSCMAFRKNEHIDTIFLFQWYKHMGIRLFYKYAQGTKQQSFNAKLVQSLFLISLPSRTTK